MFRVLAGSSMARRSGSVLSQPSFLRYSHGFVRTEKYGSEIIQDPLLNKGTSFPLAERDRLGIRGLLPPRHISVELQVRRFMQAFQKIESPLAKWEFLTALQDRNETLFYKLLIDGFEQMAPIVYTPTVGLASRSFSQVFRRPRGMFFSLEDRHMEDMRAMVWNWPSERVDVIVVTDGSRILGLGDLGICGHAIPCGKLALYVASGGVPPSRVLPVSLDAGTNNAELLADPLYLGLPERRETGAKYFELIQSFMLAVRERWPNVLVQFEDFANGVARTLLENYRSSHLCFNDDIQGTGAMTVGGLLNALRAQGLGPDDLPNQRIVCLGAGSAGLGVVDSIRFAMVRSSQLAAARANKTAKHQQNGGGGGKAQNSVSMTINDTQAARQFWILDKFGLLASVRSGLTPEQAVYARPDAVDGKALLEVIREVKPTILLGLSGVGQTFNEEVIREMAKHVERPIIFPLSNPTDHAECTAEQAFSWTNGKAIFASGSPFDKVTLANGQVCFPNQGNNMYIFPGLGVGAIVAKATRVTDEMFYRAALTLVETVPKEDLERGIIFPRISNIRDVSRIVAINVVKQAIEDGVARVKIPEGKTIDDLIDEYRWEPKYPAIIGEYGDHSRSLG
ncbi:mitochondrial malate dehydrogenase (decarboxylating) [NAD-malic enzyme] [Andalucia godoyi]|uniref:Mitochondrial malate dehydrogenase (Decarboxylating) [NAD-malic enzyme] n=1 Tax=Andalucia godoyi TaxID=505711 RepID=A0A8K0AGU3_ANDGO|nr:mitochondrial malate dehydrogenase (decarboxylating) [NAD-malic enzyme] [Andalucia godoyi]|eukprot:ANDGO_00751.mRNA.1 mitochondrial malate dehydrogenase (decarboxylating) [NAD-malic enzyme]